MNRPTAADRATIAITVLIVAAGAWIFFAGPLEVMPYHYGADGQADAWAGREAIGVGIALLGLLTGVFAGGMGVAARRAEDEARARSLRFGQLFVLITFLGLTLFAGVTSVTGLVSLGAALPMAGLSALFLLIGAVLGRVGPNPIAGVRTPWSYKSRLAWDRSNRLAGRLYFLIGLTGLALAPIAPQPLGYQVLIG
ncbi:MAG TPA: SdpI family protein, partial [Brevundimonas sp.]|nr:SdpI family protein [Brevundimonas sp.]